MDDFFKNFKENLDNRPEPVYEDRLWDRLEKDMDGQGRKPSRGGMLWWLLIPGILLLGLNVYLFSALRQTNHRMSAIELQRDTVVQTKIIYQTDTVYRTIIQKEEIIRYASNSGVKNSGIIFQFPSPQFEIIQATFSNNRMPGTLADYAERGVHPFYSRNLNWPLGVKNKRKNALLFDPEASLNQLPGIEFGLLKYPPPSLGLVEYEVNQKKYNKPLSYHIAKLQPKGFTIGLNGGWTLPVNEGLYNKSGYQAGLSAALDFSTSLRMWMDASFLNLRFETDRMDEAIGVPVIQPPSDEFIFDSAEVPQPSLQYSIGMQYLFNSKNKWKPFLGVGYGVVSLLPHEVTYDFESADFEWIFEEPVNNRQLITNFLFLQIGLEYEINKKWAWQFKTSYRTNLENQGFKSPRLMSLQTGINFRIK